MNTDLLKIIAEIVSKYGAEVLDDPRRMKALFSDLAHDVPKPLKVAFIACIEAGFAAKLKNSDDRISCKKQLAQELHDDEGFDITLCNEALDVLEVAVLAEKNLCPKCGKELQSEWNTCPYCGEATGKKKPKSIQPSLSIVTPVSQTDVSQQSAIAEKKRTVWNMLIAAGITLVFILSIWIAQYSSPIGHIERGFKYFKKGDYSNAVREYTESIKLEPTDWYAYQMRGYAYTCMDDTQKANADYEMAKKLGYIGYWRN
jgi:tetratricopeptide (TPR) repeat protein